jgi:UDP-N-acetylmuramate dehydrogenase
MSAPGAAAAREGYAIVENAALDARNTFRVPARAALLAEVHDARALGAALADARLRALPLLVLGEGSNILFTRDWPGAVLALAARGIETCGDDGANVRVRVAAGEHWDGFVHWSLAQGLCGLENLVSIPGTVGAAPIQNIGAYGVEVREFVAAVEAWDREAGRAVRLANADCAFGYRDSLFKRTPGRYVVSAVEFDLPRRRALRMGYAGIADELAAHGVAAPDAPSVAAAVARLRRRKLPDPARIGNAGSFFKNPQVRAGLAAELRRRHPGLPAWPADDGREKLSAAWLIEACGLKGLREGDAGVSEQHALVLVNHGRADGAQVLALAERVRAAVRERFGVELEPEPLIV